MFTNKKKIVAILLAILVIGGFFGWKKIKSKEQQTRYILTQVKKGEILVSVSGSGQISSLDQIDIKPKVSGEVLEILVEKDQKVKKGQILLKIDPKNYQRAIDDAQLALDNAKTSLENLKKNKEIAQKDLSNAYENAFNSISSVFNELPQVVENLEGMFTESSYGGDWSDIDYYQSIVGFYTGKSFLQKKENEFLNLKEKYQAIHKDYLLLSRFSPSETLEIWLEKTSNLAKEFADLARSGRDIISLYKRIIQEQRLTPPIPLSTTEGQFLTLANTVSSFDQKVSTLTSLSKSIDQLKTSISNYEDSIESQEKIIKQKENALSDAKENYENCFVKAPFDGIISKVNVKKGDNVSLTVTLFTLISNQKVAEISLNEIDAAKVRVGQKATLTFDAIEGLTLTGTVSEIDTVGTVSQGVVSFGIKIALDSDDERVKPGMSVTANIVVDEKRNVLVLPKSALKSQGENFYVELVEIPKEKIREYLKSKTGVTLPSQPKRQIVEVGISNDTQVEIVSGLKEGDLVVLSVFTPANQWQRRQPFQIPGIGGQMRMR